MERRKGLFIVFEGLDGSGVSTQTSLLNDALGKAGIPHISTKEPSDSRSGALIRHFLKNKAMPMHPDYMTLLFAANRIDHILGVIRPALEKGMVVLCDRYYLSSLAYQMQKREDFQWILQVNSRIVDPDITIYLDVQPELAMSRITERYTNSEDHKEPEIYENLGTLTQVEQNYKYAISKIDVRQLIKMVNGNLPPQTIHRAVLNIVNPFFEKMGLGNVQANS